MIKIVHLGDLHFGLEHGRFPLLRERLIDERLHALQAVVQRANSAGAHAIIVAGDLFDKLNLSQKLVKLVKSALSEFTGIVLVIPGNHDWYNASADDNKLWTCFIDAPGDNVHFLGELAPFKCTLADRNVTFFPCGCHQKQYDENRIDWVKDEEKRATDVNIGIAHGNVEGLGLDDEGNYFEMTPSALKAAGLDCWLLGHIHAPYPSGDTAGNETFFFSGSHCAESWKSERPGGSWLIEIGDDKSIKATRWKHHGICFKDRIVVINSLMDVNNLISELKQMDVSKTILRLTLHGALSEEESQESKIQITALTDTFLYSELAWNIGLKITIDSINKLYASESIPHTLLTALSENEEARLAMQLAFETIKSISK